MPGNNSQEPACVNSGDGESQVSALALKRGHLKLHRKGPKQEHMVLGPFHSLAYGLCPKSLSTSGGIFRGQTSLALETSTLWDSSNSEEGLHVHQEPWAKQAALPEHVTLDTTVVFALTNNQYFNSSLNTGKRRHHYLYFIVQYQFYNIAVHSVSSKLWHYKVIKPSASCL